MFGTGRPRNGGAATSELDERSRWLLVMTPIEVARENRYSYRYVTGQRRMATNESGEK